MKCAFCHVCDSTEQSAVDSQFLLLVRQPVLKECYSQMLLEIKYTKYIKLTS